MALSDKELQNLIEETAIVSYDIMKQATRNQFASAALTGLLANGHKPDVYTIDLAFEIASYASLKTKE